MRQKETEPMGCTGNSRMSTTTFYWKGNSVRDAHIARSVKDICGNKCSFPACLVKVVRENEASKPRLAIFDGDGTAQGREATLALFDPCAFINAVVQE